MLLEFMIFRGIDNILNDIDANRKKFYSSAEAAGAKGY
jgi:hypothetical protein